MTTRNILILAALVLQLVLLVIHIYQVFWLKILFLPILYAMALLEVLVVYIYYKEKP